MTVKNSRREDYGKTYEYDSLLNYLLDNRVSFEEMLEDEEPIVITDEDCKAIVDLALKGDVKKAYLPFEDISNSWKEQELIDFDNPMMGNVDVAQSMYNAIYDACLIYFG